MNIGQHPELLDKLAASYALGTLRGGARRRLEAYARQSATVRTSLLLWQERMHAMIELPLPMQPSPNVWKRIENVLTMEMEALRNSKAAIKTENLAQQLLVHARKAVALWRGAALAGAVATLAAVVVGLQHGNTLKGELGQVSAKLQTTQGQVQQAQLAVQQAQAAAQQAAQQLQYVAVLSDDKSAASVLVTVDTAKNRMTLQRVSGYQEAADKSLQLWALPAGGKPQSLGVLTGDKVIRLAADDARVKALPTLAVSLEPKGGVAEETGPTGPVLFKGALLQTAL